MPNNWKTYKLSEFLEIKNGKTKPKEIGDIPIYGGNGILGFTNKSNVNKDVLIIGRVGAYCGSVYFEDKPVWISDNALYTFPKKDDNLKFIYYLLKQLDLNQFAGGSSQPLLTQDTLNRIEVIFPPLKEQKSIASILSAIDDKIENNLAINKTLEEMAMALYKHWFVDFGPFQEGEFVESELGRIPKGWEVKQLDEIIIFKNQGVNTTTEKVKYSLEGLPVVRANNINVNYIESNNFVFVDKKTFEKVRIQCKPDKGDVLFTNIGSQLGSACISYLNFEYLIAWNVLRIKVNDEIFSPELLTTFFNDKTNRIAISNLNSSSTMPFVSGTVLGKLKIIIPNKKDLFFLQNKFKSLYDKIAENHIENQTLTQLRDTVLPKLISGEVRLKEFRDSITN